jgi:penicillin-binding protein 1C
LREPEPLWTAGAIQEKFDAQNIPPLESPDDYATLSNSKRAVRLSGEYRDWLATGDNWVGERAVLSGTADSLRIQFPPPGTTLYLDADLPQAGRRMLLRAAGPEPLEWRSDSLSLAREGNREIALLTEGHHCITVRDPASGAEARTWIEVRVR